MYRLSLFIKYYSSIFDIIFEILTKFKNNDETVVDRKINSILY